MSRQQVVVRTETKDKPPFSFECKLAFLMGFHQRLGKNSSLLVASKNPFYDRNVFRIIFGFITEIFCLENIVVENSFSESMFLMNIFRNDNSFMKTSFYRIYFGQPHKDSKVAIKVLYDQSGNPESKWNGTVIEHEAKMIHKARQESMGVVDLKQIYHFRSNYSLCLEEIPSLESQIMADDPLDDPLRKMSWRTRLTIALKVAKILKELHAAKIIHRQIRSHHILFEEKSGMVKLTDFSHAHIENDPVTIGFVNHSFRPYNSSKNYLAPEELSEGATYSTAIDIYGMGNLLYELATEYMSISGVKRKRGIGEKRKEKCPQSVKELIKLCQSFEPKKRPTASGLIETLNLLISSLPKEGASTELEFSALNHKLSSLLIPQPKLSFFTGLPPGAGEKSAPLSRSAR
jgi:serine/threonine protein kinase